MIYRCKMCGHLYDEAKEGVMFTDLPEAWVCPVCGAPKNLFEPTESPVPDTTATPTMISIDDDMAMIQRMAATGETVVGPGGPHRSVSPWSELLIMGAQLANKPLLADELVNTKTVIGKKAKHPMEIAMPIIVSHMSYGAITAAQKVAIAKGAALAETAVGGGEGGMLGEEYDYARRYIFEYVPAKYSATDENLLKADAVEIKIGQAAKPGMGGLLPGAKVTPEIATLRGVQLGKDVESPSTFADVKKVGDLKILVEQLRERSGGKPIGVKVAANNIEADMEWILMAGPDFMTIDGRGGSTGAAPAVTRDAMGVPTLYAVRRAREVLDQARSEIDLVVTGGLRTSSDIVKCLALGADVVALATGVLVALAANAGLSDDKKVANYLTTLTKELQTFARATGHHDVHDFNLDDLVTTSLEIATFAKIKHV